MAATKNCAACNNLQEQSADFVQNGVTTNVCTSLKNDTGFSASNGNNDCTDLDYANDCLIGNMEDEVDAYEVCDWKEFMKKFIHNLWTVLKAMICAICGIWTNIHNLWTKVNKHDCEINYLFQGDEFHIGENTSGDAYAVAGKGVSFIEPSVDSPNTTDLHLDYIAGGLMRGGGSYKFHLSSWDEPKQTKVMNFDNGSEERTTYNRKGNELWENEWTDATRPTGGELICEFRLRNEAFPQIQKFFPGFGQNSNNGCFTVRALVFNAGGWAYGQHGSCYGTDGDGHRAGDPTHEGYDRGHQVPSGWTYIQVRMSNNVEHNVNGKQLSPTYFMGVRMGRDGIVC